MTKLEQYATLSKEADVIAEKMTALRKEIEVELPEEGFKSELVTAFWTLRKKWTFSPKIDELQEQVKATMEKEKEDGTAKVEEVKQLTIKVK